MEERVVFPVKPTEPLDSECCGTGCTPCVFDIYKKQIKKWEEECDRIRDNEITGTGTDDVEITEENSFQLTPEKYLNFKLIGIIPDTSSSNIYRFDASPSSKVKTSLSSSVINSRPRPPPIEMGQHVVIKIENEAKQYTVLDVNKVVTADGKIQYYFDILIKIYPKGALTPLIGKLQVGDEIGMRGPFGKIIKMGLNSCKNVIMLAAGTGIAPMYRLIESVLRNEEDDTKIKLIYCNRSVESILLKSKLPEWSTFWNFQVTHFLSRNGGQPIPYGMKNQVKLKRFVRADFLMECQKLIESNNYRFFVCGTKSFEKDIINYMSKGGVRECDFHVF